MKSSNVALALALAVSLPSCFAVRRGDEAEVETLDEEGWKAPAKVKKLAKGLVKTFSDPKNFSQDRESLKKIRETEMSGGSEGTKRKYEYLGTPCLTKRQEWVAEQFKDFGCKRILEVGGYSKPLAHVVKDKNLPSELELYVDVDPSANETTMEDFSNKFPSATFQLLLNEFRINGNHVGKTFDCFLMLGTTQQNVADDDSKKALQDATNSAKMAIIEYPQSNPNTPGLFTPSLQNAGLKETNTKHTVDCSGDKEAEDKKDPQCGGPSNQDCLKRNIVVFKRSE